MNHCSSCKQEFSYWEVWRSWNNSRSRITCRSCGEENPPSISGVWLSFGLILVPLILVGKWVIDTDVPLVYGLANGLILAVLLSLLRPFVALYGRHTSRDVKDFDGGF